MFDDLTQYYLLLILLLTLLTGAVWQQWQRQIKQQCRVGSQLAGQRLLKLADSASQRFHKLVVKEKNHA